jgi:hypothetical protein
VKPIRPSQTVSWILQILAAAILLQTLYFKFTGAPESKFIFQTLGAEPWGRVGTGLAELVASLLLLWPRRAVFGALLAMGLMSGAIASHLTRLGIVVQNDGGLLFGLAVTVFSASAAVLWLRRSQVIILGETLRRMVASKRSPDSSRPPAGSAPRL